MSYDELFSIYCNLRSASQQIKRLYEDWDFGRQKQEANMASHWVSKASSKIFDILIDEFPEDEKVLSEIHYAGFRSMMRTIKPYQSSTPKVIK